MRKIDITISILLLLLQKKTERKKALFCVCACSLTLIRCVCRRLVRNRTKNNMIKIGRLFHREQLNTLHVSLCATHAHTHTFALALPHTSRVSLIAHLSRKANEERKKGKIRFGEKQTETTNTHTHSHFSVGWAIWEMTRNSNLCLSHIFERFRCQFRPNDFLVCGSLGTHHIHTRDRRLTRVIVHEPVKKNAFVQFLTQTRAPAVWWHMWNFFFPLN